MSYRAHREKKTLDENNTVRRYRADINNKRPTHEHSVERHAGFNWHHSINQSINQSINPGFLKWPK